MRRPIAAFSMVLPLCLLALTGGSCLAGTAATRDVDSGIRGVVILGPSSPSVRIGEPVRPRPFQTALTIRRAEGGSVVATVRTRSNGTFVVALPPGDYIVGSASSEQIPRPSIEPVPVTVSPHAYADVTINADSGIR